MKLFNREDVIWCSGLFDGEGTIVTAKIFLLSPLGRIDADARTASKYLFMSLNSKVMFH